MLKPPSSASCKGEDEQGWRNRPLRLECLLQGVQNP